MVDALQNLTVVGLALAVFAVTYLLAAGIYAAVMFLAVEERARAFKAVSPGMLPPLGILFGLFVAFIASQVWNDLDRAKVAVTREASALRGVVLLAGSFPGETETRLRDLVRRHIQEAVTREWPLMARRRASLTIVPRPLAEALQLALSLTPTSDGQMAAQREITSALENALDARRQRIIVSRSSVNWVKWTCLFIQAMCTLVAIAMVHSDNRTTAAIAVTLFATGVAASVLLIASHNRPFTGDISVGPDLLLQVMPGNGAPEAGP
jgi:Protein of unknown function (DUF4239)